MSKMATMKAIVMAGPGTAHLVDDRPRPRLRPEYVLVRTKAVALNPTDWKHIDWMNTPGHLSGCDHSGVVEEVGAMVTKHWKKGDRICGTAHGGNKLEKEDGAFAEFIAAKGDTAIRMPDYMSFEDAATLGVGLVTCGQGLYLEMGLNLPNDPVTTKEPILIYGGSTATGALGLQFAKLSGYTVLTTCSPRNFDKVKALGADEVYDYNDPESIEKIKTRTNNNLKLVWDTVCVESSAKFCAQVIVAGGIYGTIGKIKCPRDDIKMTYSLAYEAIGEAVDKIFHQSTAEDNARDFDFTKKWIAECDQLLAERKITPLETKIGHGLGGVIDGLDLLRNDKVSGQKLVFMV